MRYLLAFLVWHLIGNGSLLLLVCFIVAVMPVGRSRKT